MVRVALCQKEEGVELGHSMVPQEGKRAVEMRKDLLGGGRGMAAVGSPGSLAELAAGKGQPHERQKLTETPHEGGGSTLD